MEMMRLRVMMMAMLQTRQEVVDLVDLVLAEGYHRQ